MTTRRNFWSGLFAAAAPVALLAEPVKPKEKLGCTCKAPILLADANRVQLSALRKAIGTPGSIIAVHGNVDGALQYVHEPGCPAIRAIRETKPKDFGGQKLFRVMGSDGLPTGEVAFFVDHGGGIQETVMVQLPQLL